jgi:hypothetical protein
LTDYTPRPERAVAGSFGAMNNERHPDDLYETPSAAVEMLLAHHDVQGPVLEPSAGKGAIANVLRGHGYDVVAYDLHEWYGSTNVEPGVDFLQESDTRGCRFIVMNPPYKDADKHVRHALKTATSLLPGQVCVLLRLTWMAAKKRADLLPHIEKIIICGRLKMLPPNVVDAGHSGTVDYAWFVFRPFRLPLGTVIVRAS